MASADGLPTDEPWASLFSGGKDSSWALHRALRAGLPVRRLVTVHPREDSYLYHVPATDLAGLAAESIGIPLRSVDPGDLGAETATDAGRQGDRELAPLEAALSTLADDLGGLGGVIAGAVASDYQRRRLAGMASRLGVTLYAPLWGADPVGLARTMLAGGLEFVVVQVAAAGLDESWLGRRIDAEALSELERLNERHGVHVLGEGGEFETLVTDGPHMDRPLRIEGTPEWDGTRGRLRIEDAWLE